MPFKLFPARTLNWLLPVLCTVVLVLGYDLHASYQREFQIHERDQSVLGQVIEQHVGTIIDKVDITLLEAAHDFRSRLDSHGPATDAESLNRDLLRRERSLHETQEKSLRVIDAKGQVVFSAGETAKVPDVNVGDRAYFRQQRDHADAGLVMSEPILSRFTGKWLFTLSRRITDAQGRFLGIVQTAVRAEHFENELLSMQVGAQNNITLFHLGPEHKELRLIARQPSRPELVGQPIPAHPTLQEALAQNRSSVAYSGPSRVDGVERQFLFRKVRGLPLLVSFGVPRSEILREWYRKAALYGGCLLLLCAELVWFGLQQKRAAIEARRAVRQRHEGHLLDLARSTHAEQGRLQDALEEIARHATTTLDARVTVWLSEGDVLVCAAMGSGGRLDPSGAPLSMQLADHSELHQALSTQRAVQVDEHLVPLLSASEAGRGGRPLTMWVPARQGQRLLGSLSFSLHPPNDTWSDEDLSFATSIGEHLVQTLTAHELWRSLQHLQLVNRVMQTAPVSICLCSPDQTILFVNEAFERMSGYTQDELVGRPYAKHFDHPLNPEQRQSIQTELQISGLWKGEIIESRKSGEHYPQQLLIKQIKSDTGTVTHLVRLASDISMEHAQRQQIEHLAYHDTLTGLANRTLFTDRLHHSLLRAGRAGRQVALLFIDVDRFKTVNDKLGHDAGDQLLKHIAQRLKSCLRESDTLCRSGGDEFLIICEEFGDSADRLALLGTRLQEAIAKPLKLAGKEICPSISVGVAIYPRDADNDSDLQRNADIAMYLAKEQGRGCMRFFTEELNRRTQLRHELELDLRHALHSENELYMVYQPKIDLHSRSIVGLEALVRWSPEPGRHIPPDQFIGVAEETRLIEPLGQWIIDQVLRQVHRWQDGALARVPVAINVSPMQLRQSGFLDALMAACDRHGVPHALVELEITESVFIGNVQDASAQLQRIKAAGFRLALDDFGTGYSSFSYLTTLPIDTLKVDRSFVAKIGASEQGSAVLKAIIAMAQVLGLDVVAEGVETEDQAQWLQGTGPVLAQGYHFYRPARPEDLLESMSATRSVKRVPDMAPRATDLQTPATQAA